MIGEHCPIDLFDRDQYEPYVVTLEKGTDNDGIPTGKRINGYDQCPKCGLWYPTIEEPDGWSENDDGSWEIDSWWGWSQCVECDLLLVTQPDGRPEAYYLGESDA
jgi:hypothetical protein